MKGLCRDKTSMNVVDGLHGFRVEGSRCCQKPILTLAPLSLIFD